MAYVKLADGSTFQGLDSDVARAVASYASKQTGNMDFSKITVSPEVTKIVEKVPVEVEKVVEKMVQVPVLPERPLTQNEMNFLRDMRVMTNRQKNIDTAIGVGTAVLMIGGFLAASVWLAKH